MQVSKPEVISLPRAARVLVLAPHADDEVLGVGGALALHAERGDDVRVIVVFDGKLGLEPGSPESVRREEARAGGARLGVEHYEFWDYPEGHEPTEPEFAAAVERLARRIRDLAPGSIYAPWSGEAHRDHAVLARATIAALRSASFRGRALGFEVWTPCEPDGVLDIGSTWARKLAALAEHRSQLARTDLVALATTNATRAGRWLGPGRFGECFVELARPAP
jgi:LmbE family N-acetylglucosaminyl deacetylase